MKHPHYGVANWFVRQALDNECIQVFGNGKIQRDFLYVDDCIEAMLQCAVSDDTTGEVINVGGGKPTNFLELAETIVAVCGEGRWEFAPFTPERKAQEPGDFYSDITKIRRLVNWKPQVTLEDGLRNTVDYYRSWKHYYWSTSRGRGVPGGVNSDIGTKKRARRTVQRANEAVLARRAA